jgi:3-deoxy-manno-octulosonate cytidylyltransferase (CMP-KDO synthetase)
MPITAPCFGIIPARYDSSRFPGKPLVPLLGRPMFWHVYQRACQCSALQGVVLATDDERIAASARELRVPVVMTRRDHPSGTDRVLEAALSLKLPEQAVVVNIQGDEPALAPEMITQLVELCAAEGVEVATLAREIPAGEGLSPDRVKVVADRMGRALYFSRALIPHDREGGHATVWLHVGMYAFRLRSLRRFVALGPSPLERIEQLEQLRLLENGVPLHVALTGYESHGVDRPADVPRLEALLRSQGVASAAP